MVEARGLSYIYEDNTCALKGVDIQIEEGAVTAILGPNGAGKSTLFLNFNGLLRPAEGAVYFAGEPVNYSRRGLTELRRRVGIVFQDPDDQLFSADVYRDVSFGAVNLGLPEAEVRRRVEEAMTRTGIWHLRGKPTHALSHGQKKRVAIAGVLVMCPRVVILDEPTAGLDPLGTTEIMRLLLELRERLGITVIMATHDIDLVSLYCTDTYLLANGEVQFHGTPEALFRDPEPLRKNGMRLPRIAHLMEVLNHRDALDVDPAAATISAARREILKLTEEDG